MILSLSSMQHDKGQFVLDSYMRSQDHPYYGQGMSILYVVDRRRDDLISAARSIQAIPAGTRDQFLLSSMSWSRQQAVDGLWSDLHLPKRRSRSRA